MEMIKIRKSVFETNSSMVHVMAISKEDHKENFEIPDNIEFKLLNWNDLNYVSPIPNYNSGDYLYSAIVYQYLFQNEDRESFYNLLDDIKAILYANGCSYVEFTGLKDIEDIDVDDQDIELADIFTNIDNFIDYRNHYEDQDTFYTYLPTWAIEELVKDSDALLNFLFNRKDFLCIDGEYDWDYEKELDEIYNSNYKYLITHKNDD